MNPNPSAPAPALDDRPDRQRRRLLILGACRSVGTTLVLVALYYLLPLDRWSNSMIGLELCVGIAVLAGMIVWQTKAIERSAYPVIRAAEAFASTIPLFLLLFATAYFAMGRHDSVAFTQDLNRTDALYFTITIFSTVGFGDISPRSETARLVVSAQMLLDLVILGVVVRVLLGAVQRSRADQANGQTGT